MPYQIRIRRDGTSNWETNDPILAVGELGYDTELNVLKVGNGYSTWTNLNPIEANSNATSLQGINLSSSTPNTNDVIYYNGTSWVYGTQNSNAISIGGYPVSTATPTSGQVLSFNPASSGSWDYATVTSANATAINGVTIANSTPADGYTLQYSTASSTWVYAPAAIGDAISIRGYTVATGTPADNSVITFDSDTNQWIYSVISTNNADSIRSIPVTTTAPTDGQILSYDQSNNTLVFVNNTGGPGGSGTVTSVGLTMPTDIFDVSSSPITTSGTLTVTLDNQTANQVFAGPTNGAAAAPTFRALVAADIPNLSGTYQVTDTSLQSIITATDPGTGVGAGNMLYLSANKTFTGTPLTSFGRSLIDDADAVAARTTLGFDTVDSLATSPQATKTIKEVKAGVVLAKGEVVYVSGATGDNLNVLKAQADAEATSSKTIGIMMQAAANVGDLAYVMTEGLLTGVNTGSETEGTPVWLSPSTAGGWTTTKPSSPNHLVFLGWIVKVNASSGSIYVKIANGQELDELHDVAITSVANNHVLQYDTSTTPATWKNKTLANAGIAASSHTHGNITNAGAINSTSGLIVKTGTSGVLETLADSGTAGYVLSSNGAGTLSWVAQTGGGGTPGGSDTQVQFNDGGSTFGGDADFTWNKTSNLLTVNGDIQLSTRGDLRFADSDNSNWVAFQAPATVSTNVTWTLPATDGANGTVLTTNGSGKLDFNPIVQGSLTYAVFTPLDNQPPAANYATLDTLNSTSPVSVLDFNDGTDESAIFVGILPEAAVTTSGLKIILYWTADTTSTNTVVWSAEIENDDGYDIDGDGFDTNAVTTSTTHIGVAGQINKTTISLGSGDVDGLVAGQPYRLRVFRDADNGADNYIGDAMLMAVEVRNGA